MPSLMHDALLGGLARFRSLHVAPGEGEGAAGEADYAVEGVLWSDGTGAVLRLKLVDLALRRIAWSETFACGPGPDPDPEAARRIVGTLHGAIEFDCELRRARCATVSPTAWEHFVRGLSVSDSTRAEKLDEAATALAAATEADPGFGLAWSFRAYAEFARHDYLMAPDAVKAQVREMAERGAALAPDEARALSMLGYVLLLLGEYHLAEARIATAYRLNPASFDVMMDKALLCIVRGRPAEALTWLDRAQAIQPLRYEPHAPALRGDALYHLGRYDEALATFLAIPEVPARRQLWIGAALAMAGRRAEAQARIGLFRAALPGLDPLEVARRTYIYEHEADSRHLLEGIALALGED